MKKTSFLYGIIFILFGLLIIINQFIKINISLWPFLFIIGAFFVSSNLSKNNPGVLIPSTILFLLGIFFIFETSTDWQYSSLGWPTYILIVGISFLVTWIYSKNRNYLVPSIILIIFSAIFYSLSFNNSLIFAVLTIILGFFLIFDSIFKNKNESEKENK